jgi:tRNA 2-thiouridine synthesizing protein A
MPVIYTQNRVANLEPGDELEVRCTDPGALIDIPAWCRIEGHEVMEAGKRDGDFFVRLRVVQLTEFD